ncbi:MAG: hypothetical protein AB1589_24500 [Cyanobacteriota bacterium]
MFAGVNAIAQIFRCSFTTTQDLMKNFLAILRSLRFLTFISITENLNLCLENSTSSKAQTQSK